MIDLNSDTGTVIKFTANAGYPSEEKAAREELVVGGLYTVAYIRVDKWSSGVRLLETGKYYNTVMFTNEGPYEVTDRWEKEFYGTYNRG